MKLFKEAVEEEKEPYTFIEEVHHELLEAILVCLNNNDSMGDPKNDLIVTLYNLKTYTFFEQSR